MTTKCCHSPEPPRASTLVQGAKTLSNIGAVCGKNAFPPLSFIVDAKKLHHSFAAIRIFILYAKSQMCFSYQEARDRGRYHLMPSTCPCFNLHDDNMEAYGQIMKPTMLFFTRIVQEVYIFDMQELDKSYTLNRMMHTGDGTQGGETMIYEEVRRRGLKVAIARILKTIDNDIPVIEKFFGFDTVVKEAQHVVNTTHVEAKRIENGIGVMKLMGRYSGFIAMYATLAGKDVNCCLIPESPFYFEGKGGLFEFIQKRLKENKHMVIVIAKGARQDLLIESMQAMD
ncbi:ATP-dependent 6-phosphofructokinase 6 [Spatholobus suberectus]|nr:ATP-dependent 6-phosphofructokinase 6 [Spatholobus suberectus]